MKKLLFLIPIFLYADIWIIPFSMSKHYTNKSGCKNKGSYTECYTKKNENHQPLGIVYNVNKKYSISAIQYKNSIDNWSKSILISRNFQINDYLDFSLNTGFVDGYSKQNIYHLIAFPSMTLKYDRIAIDIAGTHEVIFVSFRFKIWNKQ